MEGAFLLENFFNKGFFVSEVDGFLTGEDGPDSYRERDEDEQDDFHMEVVDEQGTRCGFTVYCVWDFRREEDRDAVQPLQG